MVNASENNDEPVQDSEEKKEVILKKQATFIAMRFFREDETYEDQIMNECEAFYAKYGLYPNAIVSNPVTFDRWQAVVEDSAAQSMEDAAIEKITFAEINKASSSKAICEFCSSQDGLAEIFKTPKYQLFLIENKEYQDGVYQLFNGYSPILEDGKFTYPIIDMEATGKNIRILMDENNVSPTEIQNVCGLASLQAVYKWFNGKSVPNIDNLGIISNLLNTPIDDIVIFKNREG